MCEIAGIYSANQNVKSEWIITNDLKNRCPGDEGYFVH